MRWTYDLDARALYVYFGGDGTPVRQIEMSDGLVVDLDENGAVVGLEVLSPGAACDLPALQAAVGLSDDELAGLYWLLTTPVALLFSNPPGNLVVRDPVTSPAVEAHLTAA